MAKLGFQISWSSLISCQIIIYFFEKIENHQKSPPDLKTYHIPNAHPDEFLIEKSPQYARGDRLSLRNNAIRMLEANPKMKLFAFISGL